MLQPTPAPHRGDIAAGSGPDARAARFRAFREGAFVGTFLRSGSMERFWLSDLRRFYLFLFLIRESSWMRGGQPGRFAFGLVAARSRLSIARVSQLLHMGCATGDFRRERDPRDGRQHVFEPSEAAIALFEELAASFHAEAPPLIGLPPQVAPADDRRAGLHFIDSTLRFLGGLDLGDRGVGSLAFMLTMLDLHLYGPLASTDLIRREAERLHVTCVTIRNLLHRARRKEWLRRDHRMLSLSAQGVRRIGTAMDAFGCLIEDVLDIDGPAPDAMPPGDHGWRRAPAAWRRTMGAA